MTRVISRLVLAAAVVSLTAAVSLAQQTTSTETKTFEVLAVDGNVLVVRLPEGTRELTVPEDFRFTVNGQPLSVRELKVGMKGTATITTRTTVTPVAVTEVKNGTVVNASNGILMVRTPEGVRSFTQSDVDKRGIRIFLEGKPALLSQFHPGDTLSAVIVTPLPPRIVTEKEVQAVTAAAAGAGGAAPPVAAATRAPTTAGAPAGAAPSSAAAAPAGSAAQSSSGAGALPATASSWPLLGFASAMLLTMGLALTIRRRFAR